MIKAARTRTGHCLHAVTNVRNWYSGMRGTTECGRSSDVLENEFTKDDPRSCPKCLYAVYGIRKREK